MKQNYPPSSYGSGPEGIPTSPRQVEVRVPQTRPVVTYTLIAINAAIFVLQYLGQNSSGVDYLSQFGMKVNELIVAGQYWRLFTPMFLHASIYHIAFNVYALFVLGPGLERHYRHGRFLALFLLGGFAGNVLSFLFSPNPSLGASTAIFGLLGAELVFLYQNRKLYGQRARQGLINIAIIAAINLVYDVLPGTNIDIWGHIGGLIGGTLFAWFAGPLLVVEGAYPDLAVVDTRRRTDVYLAGVGVALLFILLAGIKIYSQRG